MYTIEVGKAWLIVIDSDKLINNSHVMGKTKGGWDESLLSRSFIHRKRDETFPSSLSHKNPWYDRHPFYNDDDDDDDDARTKRTRIHETTFGFPFPAFG